MSLLRYDDVKVVIDGLELLEVPAAQAIIDRVEARAVEFAGAVYDGATTITEYHEGGAPDLWTKRRVASVTSVEEGTTSLDSDSYRLWGEMGRIQRLPVGFEWDSYFGAITVVYVPADDSERWTEALTEMTRIQMQRTAFESERLDGGEYAYTAPKGGWDVAIARQLRKLVLPN